MQPRREKPLWPPSILGIILIVATGACRQSTTSHPPPSPAPTAQPRIVTITVTGSAQPYTITLSPNNGDVHIRKNLHFALWKLAPGTNFDFKVEITGPGTHAPKQLLPQPTPNGSGAGKTYRTIVPDTDDYYGDDKYKVIVYTPGGDTTVDPQVTVDG